MRSSIDMFTYIVQHLPRSICSRMICMLRLCLILILTLYHLFNQTLFNTTIIYIINIINIMCFGIGFQLHMTFNSFRIHAIYIDTKPNYQVCQENYAMVANDGLCSIDG